MIISIGEGERCWERENWWINTGQATQRDGHTDR
jgi:hypothetical protein